MPNQDSLFDHAVASVKLGYICTNEVPPCLMFSILHAVDLSEVEMFASTRCLHLICVTS
jgi:hypothetical protein